MECALRGRTASCATTHGAKVRIIGGTLASAASDGVRHGNNVGKVLAYLLKGASVEAGAALGLLRYGEGGRIIGKRCGRTQNIG